MLPASPALEAGAARLAGLTQRLTERALRQTFAPTADREAIDQQIQLARLLCGPCTVAELLACDGAHTATYRLTGPKGALEARITLDPQGRRLANAVLRIVNEIG